jgi:hypothetical protein
MKCVVYFIPIYCDALHCIYLNVNSNSDPLPRMKSSTDFKILQKIFTLKLISRYNNNIILFVKKIKRINVVLTLNIEIKITRSLYTCLHTWIKLRRVRRSIKWKRMSMVNSGWPCIPKMWSSYLNISIPVFSDQPITSTSVGRSTT